MRKRLEQLLVLGILTTATLYGLNYLIQKKADEKNALKEKGHYYNWKNGDIFYTVKGNGAPLLLIHDLTAASSGYEWKKLKNYLEKNYTVYTIDLLGCGRSDKPNLTYTTYMYADFIHSFIDNIIQRKATIIASGLSAFPTILAGNIHSKEIAKIILINPTNLGYAEIMPDTKSKLWKMLLETPILGRFIYNVEMSEPSITTQLHENYFLRSDLADTTLIQTYYDAAHRGNSNGRYLQASLRGNYFNANIKNSLRKLDNLFIIGSRDLHSSVATVEEYKKVNANLDYTYLSGSKVYPQLETPDKLYKAIKNYLD